MSVLGVSAIEVIPGGPELGLHAGPIFFGGIECGEAGLLVGNRLELQILGDAIKVGNTRAFDGKRLLARLTGAVVTHKSVGAFP